MLRDVNRQNAPGLAAWLKRRRGQLRAEIAMLEDTLLDAGLPLPAPPVEGAPDGDYGRQVAPYEQRAAQLRSLLVANGFVPPEAPSSAEQPETPAARAHGAPADWLDRLSHEQQARTAAEVRAARAEAGRAAVEDAQQKASAALPHLYAALQSALSTGPGAAPSAPAAAGQQEQDDDAPAARSTMSATRTVLQALGPNQAVSSSGVHEAVGRISEDEPNPATIRTNLVRLRDRGEVGHDEDLGVWWLIDPTDPTWRPSRPGLRVVTER